MKTKLICVGKTADKDFERIIVSYLKRLKHYLKFSIVVIEPKKKKLPVLQLKEYECDLILEQVSPQANLILLDELGKNYSSVEYANFLQKQFNNSTQELVFVIGGAYGFSEKIYQRANSKVALGKMTFTHQMVRVIFIEQLYRACTIIRGEKYHH